MTNEFETAHDRFVAKARRMLEHTGELQEFFDKNLPKADKKETIIVDLVNGNIIRQGNAAYLDITFGEYLALCELNLVTRMETILDLLEANSPDYVDWIPTEGEDTE